MSEKQTPYSAGPQMREGFRAIVDGWTMVDDPDVLTDRIERAAAWAKLNGPLLRNEEDAVMAMIERQLVLATARGDFNKTFAEIFGGPGR
jgi:hypothetical protein